MPQLNNGYIVLAYDFDGTKRSFGPWASTSLAFNQFRKQTGLHVEIPIFETDKTHGFRPVLGRKYKVSFSKKGVVAVSVSCLETEQSLVNLKNPKG